MGSPDSHMYVVPPSVGVCPVSTPLATATSGSGTVMLKLYVALSDGWSFTGYQFSAPLGSLNTYEPSSVWIQPSGMPSERSTWGSGTPEYSTVVVNAALSSSAFAGLTMSSASSRSNF